MTTRETNEGDKRAWRHAIQAMGPMLTEAEQERITAAAIATASRAGRTVSEGELEVLLDWAETVRMDSAILDNVLNGSLTIGEQNGEPVFMLSASGQAQLGKLVHKMGLPMPEVPPSGTGGERE